MFMKQLFLISADKTFSFDYGKIIIILRIKEEQELFENLL